MALWDKHFRGKISRIIGNKRVRTCAFSIASYIAIALPVSFFLPDYRGLVHFFGLSMASNTFIPTILHEPFIFIYAKTYPPWLVAICAGVAVSSIELVNYHALSMILDLEKIRGFRERQFYQRAEHYFNRFPFLSLVFACLTPVPFIPFRVLAVTTRYSIRKYFSSVFIGRVPRFYLLALVGEILDLPFWAYVVIFTTAFGILLARKLVERRRRR